MDITEFTKYGGWIGMTCTIILYFLFPVRRKELDDVTARLVKTLQETVGALERDLNVYKERTLTLENKSLDQERKITTIEADKKLLQDFIAGRDKATTEFQTDCLKQTAETARIVREMAESLKTNNTMTSEFVKTMREHLLNVEKSLIK